jgi:hypothetical protein
MALSGFGLLLLGFAHLLNPFGFAGLLILDAAFFWLLKRDNLLSFIFWRRIVQDFVKGVQSVLDIRQYGVYSAAARNNYVPTPIAGDAITKKHTHK